MKSEMGKGEMGKEHKEGKGRNGQKEEQMRMRAYGESERQSGRG